MLDLVLTKVSYCPQIRSVSNIPRDVHCTGSDHDLIKTNHAFQTATNPAKDKVQYRNIKGINLRSFRDDLLKSYLCDPSKYIIHAWLICLITMHPYSQNM